MKPRQLLNKLYLLVLLATFILSSCQQNAFFEQHKAIEGMAWHENQKIVFDVDAQDTIQYYNAFINIRHNNDYPFSNLFLFLTTTYPDGKFSVDTLECTLANPNGEWLGDKTGDFIDAKILLKKQFQFKQLGIHRFQLIQGMRTDNEQLKGISNVGMSIVKSD